MKFTIAASVLALVSGSLAAPAPGNGQPTYGPNDPLPTTTSYVAGDVIYNAVVSQYNVGNGVISYNTHNGKVFKSAGSGQPDITSIFTFYIPDWAAGKTCSFRLRLRDDGVWDGSRQIDVFRSIAPPERSTTGWGDGKGNQRDQFIGRMQTAHPGVSSYIDPTVNGGSFACPAGQAIGIEIVGVNDFDSIAWDDRFVTAGGEITFY